MQFSPDQIMAETRRRSRRAWEWATQEAHKQKARELHQEVERLFTQHPKEAGETYGQHLVFTLGMGARIVFCGLALLVHGIFPFWLKRTTSRQMMRIYHIIQSRLPDKPDDMDAGF